MKQDPPPELEPPELGATAPELKPIPDGSTIIPF
jgi:hypothetical protein